MTVTRGQCTQGQPFFWARGRGQGAAGWGGTAAPQTWARGWGAGSRLGPASSPGRPKPGRACQTQRIRTPLPVECEFQTDTDDVSVEVRPECLRLQYRWVSRVCLAAALRGGGPSRGPCRGVGVTGGKGRGRGRSSGAARRGQEADTGGSGTQEGDAWAHRAETGRRV